MLRWLICLAACLLLLPSAAGAYSFDDEFDGAAGAPPNPAVWWATPWCSNAGSTTEVACYNASNAYLNGAGQLVLKVSTGTMGRPYDAARVQTFKEGGWPPPAVYASVSPPVHMEARMKLPPGAGLWTAFWVMATDESTNVLELDIGEVRMTYPTIAGYHVHGPLGYDCDYQTGIDLSAGYHTYAANYYTNRVVWVFDGIQVCSRVPLNSNHPVGFRLDNTVGIPGTWGGEGGPPPASALPAYMYVNWVRAWAL